MIKQVQFRGQDDEGNVFCQPIWGHDHYDGALEKIAASASSNLHPVVKKYVKTITPTDKGIYVLVNALGAGEYWGSNVNGDLFPEAALVHSPPGWDDLSPEEMKKIGKDWKYGFPSFMNAYPYKHHVNKDPSRAFGEVKLAVWNPKMHRVELVVYLDRELCKKWGAEDVLDRIENGEFPDVSMGCLPKGSKVLLKSGEYVGIETVQEGDEVITHKGRPGLVTGTMVRPHKGHIYRVKAYGHRDALELTEEHPLWIVRKEQTLCKPSSKDVNRGRKQRICTPSGASTKKGCEECKTVPQYRFEWVRTDEACEGDYMALPLPTFDVVSTFTADQSRLLGYYLAEGCILRTKAGNPIGIQLCTGLHEEETHQEIRAIGERLGLSVTEFDVEERNGRYLSIWDRSLAELCIQHCGEGSRTKKLSSSLMGADTDTLQLFLGAYANGDGGSYKGALYLSTSSIELSEQLRIALARCGMIASINEIVHKPSRLVKVETVEYQVWVGTDTAAQLTASRHVLTSSKRLNNKRFFYDYEGVTYLMTPIESIEEVPYNDDVYNFEVEEDNSYLVEGLAVHNCKVPFDICTICGHQSKTRKDYCEHARTAMNKILPDGRKVAVRNDTPRFFDISFVFIGADKSAKMLAKLAHVGDMQCMGDFCTVSRSSAEVGETFSSVEDRAQDLADLWALQKSANDKSELAGLGILSVPAAAHLAGKHMGPRATAAFELMGLGTLAAPYVSKAFKKTAGAIKRQTTFGGHTLKIEVDAGDKREGTDSNGKKWSKEMKCSYGYIPNTKGKDGETVDIYLAPEPEEGSDIYVVRQLKKDGTHDEDKVMLGFPDKKSATLMYLKHIPAKLFGGATEMTPQAFASFLAGHEKNASSCSCGGTCVPCSSSFDKLAAAFLVSTGEKSASHSKLSEIIKSVPAGPFRKAMLPKLERAEGTLPKDVLREMSKRAFDVSTSTAAMMGLVLSPAEFQRMVLVKIGEDHLADTLDGYNHVFAPSAEIDNSIEVKSDLVDSDLKSSLLPYVAGRSIAAPVLEKRASFVSSHPVRLREVKHVQGGDSFLEKVAALYNGYRYSLVKKANEIERSLSSDPQLLSAVAGESMVQAFAGGIVKSASARVLGPESLAYLIGAHYEDRDFLAGALAQSGVLAAA